MHADLACECQRFAAYALVSVLPQQQVLVVVMLEVRWAAALPMSTPACHNTTFVRNLLCNKCLQVACGPWTWFYRASKQKIVLQSVKSYAPLSKGELYLLATNQK